MIESRDLRPVLEWAKILTVDDEPLITAMLEDWLVRTGHDVVGLAHNLAKALELAESETDAAIVDVSLGKDNVHIHSSRP